MGRQDYPFGMPDTADGDSYCEAKEIWLDTLSNKDFAELVRGFFATNHEAYEAFLRDVDEEFDLACKLRNEL